MFVGKTRESVLPRLTILDSFKRQEICKTHQKVKNQAIKKTTQKANEICRLEPKSK